MAMSTGGGGDGKVVTPQMNVTPLVDVVLCLLIIFMVITPMMNKSFWVHTPKQDKEEVQPADLQNDPNPPLVMRVARDNTIQVNGTALTLQEVPDRLRRMFAAREDHIIFFDADDEADYGTAVQAMDKAREGGAVTIATLTKALGSGAAADASAPTPAP